MRIKVAYRLHIVVGFAAANFGVTSIAAHAADAATHAYPSRPIRMIVPYPPGGATDLVGRLAAEAIARQFGQQVVVDNRGGAATVVGTEMGARAVADGYTIVVGTITSLVLVPLLNSSVTFDPVRDFAPVTMLASQPYVLTVHPSVSASSVPELLALARKSPGKLAMSSAGQGGGAHIAGEMLMQMANVRFLHVPYKGTGPSLVDLVGGHVALTFAGVTSVKPLATGGKVRALAVTTAKRSATMPELPTIAEAGLPGYATNTWNSLVVPRATAQGIVNQLNKAVTVGFSRPEIGEKLREQGADVEVGSSEQLAQHIRAETERLARVARLAGLKPR